MKSYYKHIFTSALLLTGVLTSCDNKPAVKIEEQKKPIDPELLNPNGAFNTTFDGQLFSIPSPIQTALLIKDLDIDFQEDLLLNSAIADNFDTEVKQGLILGIYGADLGYVTISKQHAKSLTYLKAVDNLSNKLNIGGAFDASFLERFEKNSDSNNADSLMVILTGAFQNADNFLKKNERKNVSGLILTGGWLESMHFASSIYFDTKNEDLKTRIGEQKQSIETLIEILTKYNKNDLNTEIIAALTDLKSSFDKVKTTYKYVATEVREDIKLAKINSITTVEISDETLNEIKDKINALRNSISK